MSRKKTHDAEDTQEAVQTESPKRVITISDAAQLDSPQVAAAIAGDLPDEPRRDPKDFSDAADLIAEARGDNGERLTLMQSMGFDPITIDGFDFLIRHPKISARRHILREFVALTGIETNDVETARDAAEASVKFLDQLLIMIQPLLYVDDTKGSPRLATEAETGDHLDTPDVLKVLSIACPELGLGLSPDVVEASGPQS